MLEKMDLNLLSVFLEVYRQRSITLASEALNMTQPGVSGALKRLQAQLNTELFVREGRGISPTHAAIQLVNELEPAMVRMENALGNLQEFDTSLHRVFNVSVNELLLMHLQPKVEADSDLGNVSIQFSMTPANEVDLLNALNMQKTDVAIDVGKIKQSTYQVKAVYQDEMVMVVRKDHPRINNQITEADYYREKHITIKMRRSNLYAVDFFTRESLGKRLISSECDSLMSMLALVANTDCLGSTSKTLADKYAQVFGLKVLPQPFETYPIIQNMIWHKRSQNNPANKWLRNKLESYL